MEQRAIDRTRRESGFTPGLVATIERTRNDSVASRFSPEMSTRHPKHEGDDEDDVRTAVAGVANLVKKIDKRLAVLEDALLQQKKPSKESEGDDRSFELLA